MSAAVWGEVANAALQATSAYLNYDQGRKANVTNLRLQKRQQDWEEQMSNTAVQRRAKDIELAGGNRALAFVNGSEATTPVVTPARVEAPHFDAPQLNTARLMEAMAFKNQQDLTKAQTYKTSAETRSMTLDSDFKEAVLAGKINYTNLGNAQDYQNKVAQGDKIRAEIRKLTSDTVAQDVANYITNHTKEDVITAVKTGAMLKQLEIPGGENSAAWQLIKKRVFEWIDRKTNDDTDYGPFHPEMLPKDWR